MVRIGVPQQISGLGEVVSSPLHATGVGLLLHGARAGGMRVSGPVGGNVGGLVGKLRGWITKNF
jgi:cell division protein FtsA